MPLLRIKVSYRILPGNIRDVSAFGITVKESGINNAVVVADKEFLQSLENPE